MLSKSRSRGVAVLLLMLLSFAPVVAISLVSNVTTSLLVARPCTWTATLDDGSPSGLTTTSTNTCAYQSTITLTPTTTTTTISSSSTTTTTLLGFPLLHVFAPGCATLEVPTIISHFDANVSISPDEWMIGAIISDSIHNDTTVLAFTTDKGNHTFIEDLFINGKQSDPFPQVVPIDMAHLVSDNLSIVGPGPGQPFNSDVQKGQFVDQYFDPPGPNGPINSGQGIWYGINTRNIQFEQNMLDFGTLPFTPTDIAITVLPMGIQPVTFSQFKADLQMGQQFALAGDIPITHSEGTSPCATPLSNSYVSAIPETFTQNWNNGTEILGTLTVGGLPLSPIGGYSAIAKPSEVIGGYGNIAHPLGDPGGQGGPDSSSNPLEVVGGWGSS